MPTIEFMGKSFRVDASGFIDNYENWCDEWVQLVQKDEGIKELTEEHWKVLNAIRTYYERMAVAPMIRLLSKNTGFPKEYFWVLFPSGPGRGACRMAGLPKPTGCV